MTTSASAVLLGIGVLLADSLPWGALLAPANLRVAVAALVVLTGLTVASYDGVCRLRSEGPA